MSDHVPEPQAQTSLEFSAPPPPAAPPAGVRLEVDSGGVGWVLFDHPAKPVNVLDTPTMERLRDILDEALRKNVNGLVFASDKPGMFIAGADVEEIESLAGATEPRHAAEKAAYGQAVFERVARFAKPTAAVITGPCLGGGYELALACDLILAENSPSVRIGLPEVQLGILPGFGGTQRLPKRIGLRGALDLILAGKTLPARPAARRGLVDALVPERLGRPLAREFVTGARDFPDRRPPFTDRLLGLLSPARARVLAAARHRLAAHVDRDEYPAPYLALEAIGAAYSLPEVAAYRREADLLGEALAGPTSRALISLFRASQKSKTPRGLDLSQARPVDRLGLVGAGVMGGGIAWLAAENDIPTRVRDIAPAALETALRTAAGLWKTQIVRHRLTPRDRERRVERLSFTQDGTGFASVDFAIEAVVEDLAIKRKVVAELESLIPPHAVIASNTSSLLIADLAAQARRPERIVGLHFFNPVHRMPLVEVVAGPRSAPEAVATAYRLALDLDKTPILVQDGPGFLVNRLLAFYLGEALHLFERGADPVVVDETLVEFGMPMGPFELLDQIGLDVADKVVRVLSAAFGDRLPGQATIGRLVEAGCTGKKSGRGFYVYRGNGHHDTRGTRDTRDTRGSVSAEARRAAGNPAPGTPAPEDILDRLLLPMVNEAARCLDEGIVRRPQDVDLGMVLGTGFPPFRGGLLAWADQREIPAILTRLEALAASAGPRFAPSPALQKRAAGFHPAS